MPTKKNDYLLGSGAVLLVLVIIVMIVFIILWNNNKKGKKCPELAVNAFYNCAKKGCTDYCDAAFPAANDCTSNTNAADRKVCVLTCSAGQKTTKQDVCTAIERHKCLNYCKSKGGTDADCNATCTPPVTK